MSLDQSLIAYIEERESGCVEEYVADARGSILLAAAMHVAAAHETRSPDDIRAAEGVLAELALFIGQRHAADLVRQGRPVPVSKEETNG
jgi:hypothetical protein